MIPRALRRERVEAAFASLPDRYLGTGDGLEATYQVVLGDIGRRWEVQVGPGHCRVRPSPTRRADVVIGTDGETWLALREGRLSGLDAFAGRRLWVRGDLDLAVGFEGLFRLPDDRPPLLRRHGVRIDGATVSALTAGTGERTVILIHGLASSKASFFRLVSALAGRYRVHAIDLPGFGSSSKSIRAPFDPPYFARAVTGFMDTLAIDSAHLIGNSMGGRVALEVGLTEPGRVRSLGLLCASMAFRGRRSLVPVVRALRPELAAIPHPMHSGLVRRQLSGMFADPARLDPAAADIVADEFVRTYRQPAARVAVAKAARNIYVEEPFGPDGFWTRLRGLKSPALFVWGDRDPLVPHAFSRHVGDALPDCRQLTIADCGHVPQVEHPDRTAAVLRRFLFETDARPSGSARPLRRAA